MALPYLIPRPSHNWKPHGGDLACDKCHCRKALDIDTGGISTGCTGQPFRWFPGPGFLTSPNTKGVMWDQLDGTQSTSGYYEPQSESGPTPIPASAAPAWAKTPPPAPAPTTAKPDWQGDFEIGDRVYIDGECEGTIMGFLTDRKLIDVLRDDDECGSGLQYIKKDGKIVDGWAVIKDEITLLTSGTRIPGEGMAAPEPHKMGLDPETIDWSKFKKIRDML